MNSSDGLVIRLVGILCSVSYNYFTSLLIDYHILNTVSDGAEWWISVGLVMNSSDG